MARTVVFGCNGPVGLHLLGLLKDLGHEAVGLCRSGVAQAPPGVEIRAVDAADREAAAEAARGADLLFSAIGIDYRFWGELWMPITEGLLHAASASGAPLIFADNVYGYGPAPGPLHEDLPGTGYGRKPSLRARMADRMLQAHADGEARVALVRAGDFFGPGVTNALLGERVFGAAARGKAAQLLGDIDQPHSYAYVVDFARALVTVGLDEGAWGGIWHCPHPPARSTREVVTEIYHRFGREPKLQVLPPWLLKLLALFHPLMRELKEMDYQWTGPFVVDDSRWRRRYGEGATDWDTALDATVGWYREHG